MILHLARVVSVPADPGVGVVVIQLFPRPGVNALGFGLRVAYDEEEEAQVDGLAGGVGDEAENELQEVSVNFPDTMGWRIVT